MKKIIDKHFVGELLMDFSETFGTLEHEHLIAILYAYVFDKEFLRLLISYLSKCLQVTIIKTSFSSHKELLQVLSQGSVLGPLLFNKYLNDLFLTLQTLHAR